MKITQAVIRNFKCFQEERFDLEGNLAVAGPNNSGKTTLLQAIATWSLALERWFGLNDFQKHGGFYAKTPITRQTFYSVPLREFSLLWSDGKFNGQSKIELDITTDIGPICMEMEKNSSEQVYARPSKETAPEVLKEAKDSYQVFFVPSVSGLSVDEPVYQRPKIDQLLGQGKSGDVLRNLLVEVSNHQDAWDHLAGLILDMFGYELLPPDDTGAHILAEYRQSSDGARLDINSAGSGSLQVLLLLAFLIQRKGSVLLLDEPDAHLHVILQDTIHGRLKKIARESNSQLIIATHSEVVINAVEPKDLLAMLGHPRKLASRDDRSSLVRSLAILSNTDILLAQEKRRILYVEGRTDLNILMEWALALKHPLADFLQRPFWKPVVFETRNQGKGIKAQEHFDALLLAQEGIRGVQIVDRDGNEKIPTRQEAAEGNLLKLCWSRYEIESYLVHPDSLARFVGMAVGESASLASVQNMKEALVRILPESAINAPLGDHATLVALKARRDILSPIFNQAGLQGFSYTRYDEVAATMRPDEIHPDVTDTLNAVANHFKL